MKILDILRKLGILRYGTKAATYTSAKDMPAEFLMDDVYNAEKDLTTREDLAKVAGAVKAAGGRKVLFWVAVFLAAVSVLFIAAGGGISSWLLLGFMLWAGVLYLMYQFAYSGRFSYAAMIGLVAVGLLASLLLLGATAPV